MCFHIQYSLMEILSLKKNVFFVKWFLKVHCKCAYQIILKYVTSKPGQNDKFTFPILKHRCFYIIE